MKIKALVFAVLISTTSFVTLADSWPVIPTPKDSKISVVSEDTIFNGVPMKMWEMNVNKKSEEVLDFYRKEWAKPTIKGAPGFTENEYGEWKLISRMEDEYLLTVQVKDRPLNRTLALIAMSTLPMAKNLPAPGKGFPVLADTLVMNDIKSSDGNKDSRTIIAQNNRPVTENIKFYRRLFRRKGWTEISENLEPHPKAGALMFDKRNKELNLTVTKNNKKTDIVAVFVTN